MAERRSLAGDNKALAERTAKVRGWTFTDGPKHLVYSEKELGN